MRKYDEKQTTRHPVNHSWSESAKNNNKQTNKQNKTKQKGKGEQSSHPVPQKPQNGMTGSLVEIIRRANARGSHLTKIFNNK